MSFLVCHFDTKLKKLSFHFLFFLILLTILFFTIAKNNYDDDSEFFFNPMSRIVLLIPYVIYNLCISDKRIMELNFNFNRKDFIIFALIIIIHFFFNCSRLWNSYYIYINNNTYIVSILNYTNKILTIILLSLLTLLIF